VAIHGTWNALTGVLALISLRQVGTALVNSREILAGMGVIAILGLFVAQAVSMALVLRGLTLYVRKRSPALGPSELQPAQPVAEMDSTGGNPA
jgi:hypothetical protein